MVCVAFKFSQIINVFISKQSLTIQFTGLAKQHSGEDIMMFLFLGDVSL